MVWTQPCLGVPSWGRAQSYCSGSSEKEDYFTDIALGKGKMPASLVFFKLHLKDSLGNITENWRAIRKPVCSAGDKHFSGACCNRMRAKGFKLKEDGLRFNIKTFLQ